MNEYIYTTEQPTANSIVVTAPTRLAALEQSRQEILTALQAHVSQHQSVIDIHQAEIKAAQALIKAASPAAPAASPEVPALLLTASPKAKPISPEAWRLGIMGVILIGVFAVIRWL